MIKQTCITVLMAIIFVGAVAFGRTASEAPKSIPVSIVADIPFLTEVASTNVVFATPVVVTSGHRAAATHSAKASPVTDKVWFCKAPHALEQGFGEVKDCEWK
jgi:hypothetical protein